MRKRYAVILCGMVLFLVSSVDATYLSLHNLKIDVPFHRVVTSEKDTARFEVTLSNTYAEGGYLNATRPRVMEVSLIPQEFPEGVSGWFEDSSGNRIAGLILEPQESRDVTFVCRVNKFSVKEIMINLAFYCNEFDPKHVSRYWQYTEYRKIYLIKEDKEVDFLDISPEDAGKIINPGDVITYTLNIQNRGPSAVLDVGVENLSRGWEYSITTESGEPIYQVYLTGGASRKINVNLMSPNDEDPGVYDTVLSIHQSEDNPRKLKISTKVVREEMLNVLDVDVDYPGKTVGAGDEIGFKVTLNNKGIKDTYKLNAVKIPGNWNYVIENGEGEEITKVDINPGDSITLSFKLTPPANENEGEYNAEFSVESVRSNVSKNLILYVTVLQEKGLYDVQIRSPFPEKNVMLGESIEYSISLSNEGREKDTYSLIVRGLPPGWETNFKEGSGNSPQISTVEVDAGMTKNIVLQVNPPSDVGVGVHRFQVIAMSSHVNNSMNSSLRIQGSYKMEMLIENLYATADPGEEKEIEIKVQNSGLSNLRDVELDVAKPDRWDVKVSPARIASLSPGSAGIFNLIIKPPVDTGVGDYVIKVGAESQEIETGKETLRVTVGKQTIWGFMGLFMILSAVILVIVLFKRFGRR